MSTPLEKFGYFFPTLSFQMANNEIIPNVLPMGSWALPPMYAPDSTQRIRVWQIGYDDDYKCMRMVHGLEGYDSSLIPESTEVVLNKSGRNHIQQALVEVNSRQKKKRRKEGYCFYWEQNNDSRTGRIPVQEAYTLYPDDIPCLKGTSCHLEANEYPVLVDYKYDGIRGRAWRNSKNPEYIEILSRGLNREFLWLERIKYELCILFSRLEPSYGLDGELYIHGVKFNQLTSIIKTEGEKHPWNDSVKYVIFDVVIPNMVTEHRVDYLTKVFNSFGGIFHSLELAPHFQANNFDEIEELMEKSLSQGFEGLMIRRFGYISPKLSLYRGNRNKNLIKYKRFKDDIGVIVEVHDGKGTNSGCAIFTLLTSEGNVITVPPAMDKTSTTEYYQRRHELIGRLYCFTFQETFDTGMPRFPIGRGFFS